MSPKEPYEDETVCPPSSDTYIPQWTISQSLIFPLIGVGSIIAYGSGLSMCLYNDAEKVWFKGQWHRLFTPIIAVYDWSQFFVMLSAICMLWYWLPSYQRRFSTLFVLYEFFKVNIILQLLLVTLYAFLFWLTTMKNFMIISGGILPYTLFIFLKESKYSQSSSVWFFCAPFPVPPFLRALFVATLCVWFGPEPHSCIFVTAYWLLTSCPCCSSLPCQDGPLCPPIFQAIEALLPTSLTQSPYFMNILQNNQTFQSQKDSEIELKHKDSESKKIQT